ncbi:hypothetical protein ABAC460_00325 [Asticcacaulis sp. AC460]|nr:hypothetical protein ABAC460_00325 [Asticcacaulis sp. AC460]
MSVSAKDKIANVVLTEALDRGKRGRLSQPIRVIKDSSAGQVEEPLLILSWDNSTLAGVDWDRMSSDVLLDRANIQFLSANGMKPFYDYCFLEDGNHAEVATEFCTKTMIAAMKQANFKRPETSLIN